MKQRILITVCGLLSLVSLTIFGRIESQKSAFPHAETVNPAFDINTIIQKSKQKLSSSQTIYLNNLENSISRGDVKQQTSKLYNQLTDFWKDSAKIFEPYAYYLSESAKFDNSEKKLTFAAQLILDRMRGEENEDLKEWEATTAIDLFERTLKLDPENDELKIGLGSCYVYGKGMIGDATETMKGIQQLLQVVKKDSTNMKAQMVLGIGGAISRQYDKAIERLQKVVTAEPSNIEAVSWLADSYAGKNDKQNAVKWYQYSKKLINNPEYSKEVDKRINALK